MCGRHQTSLPFACLTRWVAHAHAKHTKTRARTDLSRAPSPYPTPHLRLQGWPWAISYVLWCLSIGEMNHFIYHRHFYGMYITPLASAQYVFYTYSSASTPARCPMWPPSSLCLVSIRPQWILLQRSLALLTAGAKSSRNEKSSRERSVSWTCDRMKRGKCSAMKRRVRRWDE